MNSSVKALIILAIAMSISTFSAALFAGETADSQITLGASSIKDLQKTTEDSPAEYPVDQNGTAYKVNPDQGKTCWIAAKELPATICGPQNPCAGLPEDASCYILEAVPNCCTFCPAEWSASC